MKINTPDPKLTAAAQIISDEALATLARINKTTPEAITEMLKTPKGQNQVLKANFLKLIKTGAALVQQLHAQGQINMNPSKVHILPTPNGRFSFVGSLPLSLGEMRKATQSDVMGGRAKLVDGVAMAPYFPVFDTEEEARTYAASKGVNLAN